MNIRKFDVNSPSDRDTIIRYYALIEKYLQAKGYADSVVWMNSLQQNQNGFILQYNETILGMIEINLFNGIKGRIGKLFWYSPLPAAVPVLADYALELGFGAGCTEIQYEEEKVDIVTRSISRDEFIRSKTPPTAKEFKKEEQVNGNEQRIYTGQSELLQPTTIQAGNSTASFTSNGNTGTAATKQHEQKPKRKYTRKQRLQQLPV